MMSASLSSSNSPSHSQTRHRRRTRSTVRFIPLGYATYTPGAVLYRRAVCAGGWMAVSSGSAADIRSAQMLERSSDA
jgi:hypothetical protein